MVVLVAVVVVVVMTGTVLHVTVDLPLFCLGTADEWWWL